MCPFGTKRLEFMEGIWQEAVYAATTTGNSDLKTTMQMVRQDLNFKNFKRSRL